MECSHRPSVVIADDHLLVAEACKALLETEFNVVSVVLDGHTLLRAVFELRPNVAIVDIAMPNLNGPKAKTALSIRQRQVLQMLAEGKSMKEVAFELDVRPGTVAFHKYKIMETLDIKSNAALIEYAVKNHMVAH